MGSLLIEIPAWLAGSNHLLFNTAQIWRFTRGAQNLRLTKSRPWVSKAIRAVSDLDSTIQKLPQNQVAFISVDSRIVGVDCIVVLCALHCRINRPLLRLMLLLQITMGVSVVSQSVSESAFAWPSKVSGDGENDAAPRISSARHAARGKGRRVKQGRKDCRNLTMKMLLE